MRQYLSPIFSNKLTATIIHSSYGFSPNPSLRDERVISLGDYFPGTASLLNFFFS